MKPRDIRTAEKLYKRFWSLYPDQLNPTDINTPEKAAFLILVGYENLKLMQQARKDRLLFTRPNPIGTRKAVK